ncbi:PREDICTED: uncharacterized protein LOC106740875 [Dinoponera quadriceps]|uniref:Uncharacterized protein LOC106740875 n=1 Tax=Dinoponera quadriceps TaxID=609295 RepID=A0A6P3WP54_DINQU|nr:PREDICTED: uncharacterized protein LOC106740875 [Dinoponera quadriceps]
MEKLFELYLDDENSLLPYMKQKLLSGSAQVTIERILSCLKNATQSDQDVIVWKLVRFDVISTICDVMQTSDDNFVRVALKCFELASIHKRFYENHAAMNAVESMLRLTYCINKSLKDSILSEKLVQSICNVLVRSSELAVDLNDVCVPQQIVLLVKNLDVHDSQRDKLKFTAVTMLNVVLQRAVFDDSPDEEMIIDVCRDAMRSMTEIVKYGEDDNAILLAAVILCGTCAGGSRFCGTEPAREEPIGDDDLTIRQKKFELSVSIYEAMMTIIIPYVKDADLSRIDSVTFHRNLVSCLNNLYQLKSCNHDNLSNHLAANGYLEYFLRLTVQLP